MRGCSPLFGGATQYGSNASSAYPGQFNFWADVGPRTPLPFQHLSVISRRPPVPAVCRADKGPFYGKKNSLQVSSHIYKVVLLKHPSPIIAQADKDCAATAGALCHQQRHQARGDLLQRCVHPSPLDVLVACTQG